MFILNHINSSCSIQHHQKYPKKNVAKVEAGRGTWKAGRQAVATSLGSKSFPRSDVSGEKKKIIAGENMGIYGINYEIYG